ncbi:hypothetical protein AB5I41_29715 [Sphingomonas sp. MMS24-JH45]
MRHVLPRRREPSLGPGLRGDTSSVWLAAPTRFAGLSLRQAQVAAALVLALLLACFAALPAPAPPPGVATSAAAAERSDIALYRGIVSGVAAGGDYYDVAASALRADGYPRPFVAVRLPTLARVQAMLPDWLSVGLLFALAALTVVAWYRRLASAFARTPPRLVVGVLAIGGLAAFVRADLVAFHELWAGPLVALSLATWRPGKAATAIALALAAMLIRETAALYAGIMAVAALAEGRRREVLGWAQRSRCWRWRSACMPGRWRRWCATATSPRPAGRGCSASASS